VNTREKAITKNSDALLHALRQLALEIFPNDEEQDRAFLYRETVRRWIIEQFMQIKYDKNKGKK
jgi:hypothetical protein